ncbi:hypothetical protein SLEP1_g48058 [Rubroshorea leprosula]|uniref:Uncharacterized protein n=1 Tax=Rubroshorea leprosula TaxID=152421 RepID=A0AAV5LUQ4_9ROSI|nr:hypothetical protein SLEP1_g48058 [Rubroshorea leprosula]
MVKPTTLFLLVALLVFFVGEGMIPKIVAKDCHTAWNCKGEDRCRYDCNQKYHGNGACDLSAVPFVPKQCFCAYKC